VRIVGLGTVHDLLRDFIVYRNLVPVDRRLPGFGRLAREAGLSSSRLPRKRETTYGSVLAELLRRAALLDGRSSAIRRIVYVGDTQMNDGLAFDAVCRAGNWPGAAFIGSETEEPARREVLAQGERTITLANRWSALAEFEAHLQERGIVIDGQTAILLDLDKTLIGARGRNDSVIDHIRARAAAVTVRDALGTSFDSAAFEAAYLRLNRPDCHPFTSDNQDNVVFTCLILGTEQVTLESVLERVQSPPGLRFEQFLEETAALSPSLSVRVRDLDQQFRAAWSQGDPTPFKVFRRREFEETTRTMRPEADPASAEELLTRRLVMTAELWELAGHWRSQGALLFGLSDKPDEACFPPENAAAELPIHQCPMHIVGG